MRTLSTDVAIIGAGTAGQNASREVERAGAHWLLIESGPYGTTCARTGCMPSKLLIAAADVARSARDAAQFGVRITPEAIDIDGHSVLARVRRERDRFVESNAALVEKLPAARRIAGSARFVAPDALEVDDHTRIYAKAFVIASGSRPIIPPELQPVRARVLTSDELFELPTLPGSLAVFGTGAIGLELGQALAQLGVRVAFYNPYDQLGPFTDPIVDRHFRDTLRRELTLHLGVTLLSVREDADGVTIRHRDADGLEHEARYTQVLAAVGRRPNVQALNLHAAGLAVERSGLPSYDPRTRRCGDSAVFIAGDADGERALMHEAVNEGCIAGANAARFPSVSARPPRVPISIGFTHPQLAMVGQSFKQAEAAGCVIGEASYADQGRARVMAKNQGHVRVYVEREGYALLGSELFGPDVEHTAHLLAWAVQRGMTLPELLAMPFYHPTVEEGIRTALRDAARQLDLLRGCAPEERGEGIGS